jgi:hypothetical protein
MRATPAASPSTMATFATQYAKSFAALVGPLSADHGMPESHLAEREALLGISLPDALREFYLTAGRFDPFNQAFNRLYPPDQWFIDSGKLVFLEENQAVVFWGVEATDERRDDPVVFQGVNVSREPIEWHLEHEHCSEFLVVMLHWQAVCGGLEFTGGCDAPSGFLNFIERRWQFAGQAHELRAYHLDGQALCEVQDKEALSVFAAGRTKPEYQAIKSDLRSGGVDLDDR